MKDEKPTRLYFKSFIKALENSVGSNLFRNFYVSTTSNGVFDALNDGQDSCAFYVSSLLVIFHKIKMVHGTVDGLKSDLKESGWQLVKKPKTGDVLIWEAKKFKGRNQEHAGFYLKNNQAISISYKQGQPKIHNINFDQEKRRVSEIYRLSDWEYLI